MKDKSQVDISIVIVNYNVKSYLSNLLDSLQKARKQLSVQIIVVDNASIDGSPAYLKAHYPDIELIENKRNIGFAKANNRALPLCRGKYTLIINPDTLVEEDTLVTMKTYMDNHPETGIATCSLLNADGTFSPDCIRTIPTPLSALFRVLGMEKFAQRHSWLPNYYISHTKPESPTEVPIISGSLMFCRTRLLNELNGFDEQFFMYFEDTDLCLRVKEKGYNLKFIPDTSVIHYRGKSTKKDRLDHHLTFNKSLFKFYRKHYRNAYSLFVKILIALGIAARAAFVYAKSLIKLFYRPVTDILVLNILITASFIFRYDLPLYDLQNNFQQEYLAINIMATILFIAIGKYYDLYGRHKYSKVALLKTNTWTFLGIAVITFFLRDFAFSRLILIVGFFAGFIALVLIRMAFNVYQSNINAKRTALSTIKILIVGDAEQVASIIKGIRTHIRWNYELAGVVLKKPVDMDRIEDVPVIGGIENLAKLTALTPVDEVFFILGGLQYQEVLSYLSQLAQQNVTTRIIPKSHEVILGQSNVEYFGSVPVLDIQWQYQTTWNKIIKRLFDITVSAAVIIFTAPIYLYYTLKKEGKITFKLYKDKEEWIGISLFEDQKNHRLSNLILLMGYVLKGHLSFVGAPLVADTLPDPLYYKYGLTGYRQINEHRFYRENEKLKLELYYLQNYAIWMDMEVLLKTVLHAKPKFGLIKTPP